MPKDVFFIRSLGGVRNIDKLKAHVKYIGFRSKEKDEKGLFDRDSNNADMNKFMDRIRSNNALKHHNTIKGHKLTFNLYKDQYAAYRRSGKDFKDIIRNTLSQYEKEHGVKLDWIANSHKLKEDNPHCHVVIKGVSDIKGDRGYKRIRFKKQDFQEMRGMFRNAFNQDVQYKFHERIPFEDAVKDVTKNFNDLMVEKQQDKISTMIIRELAQATKITRAMKHYNDKGNDLTNLEDIKYASILYKLSEHLPKNIYRFNQLDEVGIEGDIKDTISKLALDIIKENNYDGQLKEYLDTLDATDDFKKEALEAIINNAKDHVIESVQESNKKGNYQIDQDKINKVVEVFKAIDKPMNNDIEQQNVANRMALVLNELNLPDEEIRNYINVWSIDKNLSGVDPDKSIQFLNEVNNIRQDYDGEDINTFSDEYRSAKYMDSISNSRKFNLLFSTMLNLNQDADTIENTIYNYADNQGYFENEIESFMKAELIELNQDEQYTLSDKGWNEYLKVKKFSPIERTILENIKGKDIKVSDLMANKKIYKSLKYGVDKAKSKETVNKRLLADHPNISRVEQEIFNLVSNGDLTINDLLNDPSISSKLIQKPTQFQLKKYDAAVIRSYFGKENEFTLEKFKETLAEKFKSEDKRDEEYKLVTNRINKLVDKGIVIKNDDCFTFSDVGLHQLKQVETEFKYTSYDANVLSKYIDQANGSLNKETLLEFLKKEYQTQEEVDKQYKYLINRYEKNISSGYMSLKVINGEECYSMTKKGIEKRAAILNPKIDTLKEILQKLKDNQLISITNGKYSIHEKYKIKKDTKAEIKAALKDYLLTNVNNLVGCNILSESDKGYTIDQDKINIVLADKKEKCKLNKQVLNLLGKQDTFSLQDYKKEKRKSISYRAKKSLEVSQDYKSLRDTYRIPNIKVKTMFNASTILFANGMDKREVSSIISDWGRKASFSQDKINEIIEKAELQHKHSDLWERTNPIYQKDWEDMFKTLGVTEPPEWMYRSTYQHSNGLVMRTLQAFINAVKQDSKQKQRQGEFERQNIFSKMKKKLDAAREVVVSEKTNHAKERKER